MLQKEFKWLSIEHNKKWLGLFEIKIADYNEVYRVIIDYEHYNEELFCHYKFERFDFKIREWSMKLQDSPYSFTVYYNIKQIFLNHITDNDIQNVLITFSFDNPKRMATSKYFCNILVKTGFRFIEVSQLTYKALLCYKSPKLLQMSNAEMLLYLEKPLSNVSFY